MSKATGGKIRLFSKGGKTGTVYCIDTFLVVVLLIVRTD